MSAIFILIPISLIFLGLMVAAFFWATGGDQFDGLDEESRRPLEEDDDLL